MLEARSISKTFPGNRALDGVDFSVAAGTVHALLGQNGSGKSTLVKIITGFYVPDPGGAVLLDGVDVTGDSIATARSGARWVHQTLGVIDEFTAVENVSLAAGYQHTRSGRIDWKRQRKLTADLVRRTGVTLDLDTPLGRLSPTQRTAVAIARALHGLEERGQGLLLLDEPTAAFAPDEVASLFDIVRDLTSQGVAVIYVSHRLEEIFEIADQVTVLRGGKVIAATSVNQLDKRDLVELVAGGAPTEHRTHEPRGTASGVAMRVTDMRGRELHGVSFEVHKGELIGIAGVSGSGRGELPYALAGVSRRTGGDISGPENGSAHSTSPPRIALVPGDRPRQGVIEQFSTKENMSLPWLRRLHAGPALSGRRERREVLDWMRRADVRPSDPEHGFGLLSGGNQQKAIICKWLASDPDVLVLDEPTAGVDVGARAAIYDLLRQHAERGLAVVVSSSDLLELQEITDRVLVLRGGVITDELQGDAVTETALLHALSGWHPEPGAGKGETDE